MRNDQLFGESKEVHHRSGPELVILLSKNTTKMSFGKEMTFFSFLEVNQKFKTILPDQILIYFYLLLGTRAGLYVLITNFVYQVSSRHVHKFLSVLRLYQN